VNAIVRMQFDQLHLLWGPPGTGKTHTVGISISEHIREGKSVLLLSTSNAAVDEMVRSVSRSLGSGDTHCLFRFGATFDPEIEPFTCMGLLERRRPDYANKAKNAERSSGS
jgi:superfamily I DNA/RNA helicase